MKKLFGLFVVLLLSGCVTDTSTYPVENLSDRFNRDERILDFEEIQFNRVISNQSLKEKMIESFGDVAPVSWGENIDGVITEIDTDEKVVALTFDACDGRPDSYDEQLINFLIKEEVPATLFIAGQWIEENQAEFIELKNNPLFEIANHGYNHKPLSVTGEAAYNITGTESLEEAFDEVYKNQTLIYELTGEYPNYFRSGTAFYDDVSVEIINELGLKAVNYNVLGDAGGTFNKQQIIRTFETAEAGSIFLFHMNQPNTDIASGVKEGIMHLKEQEFDFVQLQEYDQFLK